jgi:hypothetical protein
MMTMTAARQTPATAASAIDWTAVQAGVWVGKCDGEFAGMIEAHWGDGFVATTRLARQLGTFKTVEEAQAAFEAH